MKIVRIRDYFDAKFKEYVVGPKQAASRGIYLVLGEMEEGEAAYIGPEFEGEIEAREEVRYFSAGGHVPGGHGG